MNESPKIAAEELQVKIDMAEKLNAAARDCPWFFLSKRESLIERADKLVNEIKIGYAYIEGFNDGRKSAILPDSK